MKGQNHDGAYGPSCRQMHYTLAAQNHKTSTPCRFVTDCQHRLSAQDEHHRLDDVAHGKRSLVVPSVVTT